MPSLKGKDSKEEEISNSNLRCLFSTVYAEVVTRGLKCTCHFQSEKKPTRDVTRYCDKAKRTHVPWTSLWGFWQLLLELKGRAALPFKVLPWRLGCAATSVYMCFPWDCLTHPPLLAFPPAFISFAFGLCMFLLVIPTFFFYERACRGALPVPKYDSICPHAVLSTVAERLQTWMCLVRSEM